MLLPFAVLFLVIQSCLTICNSMDSSSPGSSVHGDSPGENTGVGCHVLLQGNLPNPGIKSRSATMQVDSLLLSHQGSPKILEWVAYPFSRGIFLTQELNQGLLHCRQILYQLSYHGSSYFLWLTVENIPLPIHLLWWSLPFGWADSH